MLYYLGAFTSPSNPTCTETLCWTVLFAPIYDVATVMSPSGFKFLFWRLKEMVLPLPSCWWWIWLWNCTLIGLITLAAGKISRIILFSNTWNDQNWPYLIQYDPKWLTELINSPGKCLQGFSQRLASPIDLYRTVSVSASTSTAPWRPLKKYRF